MLLIISYFKSLGHFKHFTVQLIYIIFKEISRPSHYGSMGRYFWLVIHIELLSLILKL